jgi:hypothetical protein
LGKGEVFELANIINITHQPVIEEKNDFNIEPRKISDGMEYEPSKIKSEETSDDDSDEF